MLSDRQHVPTIAGHEDLYICAHAARQNHVVVGVAGDRLDLIGRGVDARNCDIEQERLYLTYSIGLKAELEGQDPLELVKDRVGQDELDASFDR